MNFDLPAYSCLYIYDNVYVSRRSRKSRSQRDSRLVVHVQIHLGEGQRQKKQ